ncbi:MAG: hypothetical protein MUC85_08555 [Anaerolineales bacterium]|jgi:hypothetical protein|nr:hypothetical protein [Anaerolineales bacterium]
MNKATWQAVVTCMAILFLVFSFISQGQQAKAQELQAPGAFNKLTPINLSASRSVWSTTITWDTSADATEYEYCYDKTDDNTCDSSWTSAGTNTSAEITFLEAITPYYWQVRAYDGEGYTEADDGAWWKFTTGANARFHAQLVENNIAGYDWHPGDPVTVTVDDPSNGTGIDFTDTKTVDAYGSVTFYDLGGLQVSPGMVITMTDGIVNKYHTVINLDVTEVNIVNDTVSGTGLAGVRLHVQHCQFNGCLWRRWVTVQPDGTWQVDFSVPGVSGDEQEILDLVPGTSGEAVYPDIDSDHTDVNWYPTQKFESHPEEERVDGFGWLANATISLEIDDPATPANPDYSGSTTSLPMPGNPSDTWFNLDFNGQYDLKTGDVVTVTDGTTTKQHTVTSMQITEANATTDVVSGTAAPNSYVDLQTCFIGGCAYRTELADSNGNWAADFSVVGDQPWEIITLDIRPGTNGDARQVDADIDTTMIHWFGTSKVFLPLVGR